MTTVPKRQNWDLGLMTGLPRKLTIRLKADTLQRITSEFEAVRITDSELHPLGKIIAASSQRLYCGFIFSSADVEKISLVPATLL